ncbi:hypothetical protein MTF65_07990 [Streptomyces sp. APSN-46.1]|uniref:hypothetical protein n=1 Tax=Streptomyces sp. APSN-46.1 TaxID=2929049 RepID=UPI001FB2FECF|nr:hypothetical protein [Streptomyces sp. APSN-46.1]MCJ1677280.1 hypothetical protein [Streptomyces sp. APSN-46.1]
MSQETTDAVDPKTEADEEALDRALAAGRSGAPRGRTDNGSPPKDLTRSDGSPAARRQPSGE